jgi:hypothetical protein
MKTSSTSLTFHEQLLRLKLGDQGMLAAGARKGYSKTPDMYESSEYNAARA